MNLHTQTTDSHNQNKNTNCCGTQDRLNVTKKKTSFAQNCLVNTKLKGYLFILEQSCALQNFLIWSEVGVE